MSKCERQRLLGSCGRRLRGKLDARVRIKITVREFDSETYDGLTLAEKTQN